MCEFCTAHGEGQKWYLQMKNYADELIHEELSSAQQAIVEAPTRAEWMVRFFEESVVPASTGVSPEPEESEGRPKRSEEEIIRRWKVAHLGQVLPLEDVESVLDMADSITRMPCGCRFISTGQTDKRYCFGLALDKFGILGRFPDAASSLEVLDRDEAKAIFRRYDEEGLVHTVWTAVTPYVSGLCNCDRDCRPYQKFIVQRSTPFFLRGEYLCQVDWDLCTGCKSCMSQCQFGAQFYSSALSKVHIDPRRCFGCGVCRAACPHEAIKLIRRQEHPQAADLWLKA